jgi:integrase
MIAATRNGRSRWFETLNTNEGGTETWRRFEPVQGRVDSGRRRGRAGQAPLKIEPEKPKGAGITLAQAADRYVAAKTRKRTLEADRRRLELLKAALDNVPRIRLEKEPQGRLRWLTQEEITRLLDAAAKSKNKELRANVIIALNTGLRLGELLGLTWERVDLSRVSPPRGDEERQAPRGAAQRGVLRCASQPQPQAHVRVLGGSCAA